MKKILFAVSDAHGCYTELREALYTAGFMVGEPNHVLIAVGDMFDRGSEQLEMYNFLLELDGLGQLQYVLGNHDLMLMELSSEPAMAIFNYDNNGLKQTVNQIFNLKKIESKFNYMKKIARSESYRKMAGWLRTKPLYFETEDYIFAHAGLPQTPTWKKCINHNDTWTHTYTMLGSHIPEVTGGKFLVCGHWHAYDLKARDQGYKANIDDMDSHGIYFAKNGVLIGLDACSNYTKKVNVLVVQQEM